MIPGVGVRHSAAKASLHNLEFGRTMNSSRIVRALLNKTRRSFPTSSPSLRSFRPLPPLFFTSGDVPYSITPGLRPTSPFAVSRAFSSDNTPQRCFGGRFDGDPFGGDSETEEDLEESDGWEEENDAEPEVGDGGDGGGVVLQNVPWGEHVLSIARQVLVQFGDDMELFAFKTTPRGYIYVRLDKLSNEFGCPTMEEMGNFSQEYKKRLDEAGATGEIPDNLALEVSSPGAERLLKVPDDLDRFKDMPMRISYVEEEESKCDEKTGIFLLEDIDHEAGNCTWKLANVKENRDALGKGRPLNRKQRDWRLQLPSKMCKKVSLYVE